jgi:hypothetical protein
MRKIVFAGLDTLAIGIRINSERTKVTELTAKTSEETIAYRNGDIVSPAGLKSVNLIYCFVLHDTSREAVAAKARQIAQTFSNVKGDLLDSDMPGEKYTNAVYVKSDPLEYVSRNFVTAYMMVNFKADPIPQELSTVNERVLKLAAVGTVTLNITNNSSYTITAGGSTSDSVSYTAVEPYKYRLVVYAENPETVTLNGAAITAGTVFTMPSSAEIIVSATGYKYVELWHDTRTGVRL